MDILKPQYRVIIRPTSGAFIPIIGHTELEIGFGNGEYTAKYARSHPELMLYGLEISQACVFRCARRASGLDNLRLINTDARYMLRELFDDESFEKVFMQFPCPWAKQAHRRVTAKDFADGLACVLKTGGMFEMLTDDDAYALEVEVVLGRHPALVLVSHELNPQRDITTKYERKWLSEGKDIHRLRFMKTERFTARRRVEREMHIKTEHVITHDDVSRLTGTSGKREKEFWRFGRVFTDGTRYLVETLTSDDEFEQKFYVSISPKDAGSIIRLDKTADAFLTPSVRDALSDAAMRLS